MKLYTVAEVSAETGLSEKAIRRRIEKETLISTIRGGRRLIPESELERVCTELGIEWQTRGVMPPESASSGQGRSEGWSGGMELEPIMRELADTRGHVERLAREAEREKLQREQAEARALSEQEARAAAQAEVLEVRARNVELEALLQVAEEAAAERVSVNLENAAPLIASEGAELAGVVPAGAQAVTASESPQVSAGEAGTVEESRPPGRLARFLGIG